MRGLADAFGSSDKDVARTQFRDGPQPEIVHVRKYGDSPRRAYDRAEPDRTTCNQNVL